MRDTGYQIPTRTLGLIRRLHGLQRVLGYGLSQGQKSFAVVVAF